MTMVEMALLAEDEPAPVCVTRADGASPFFLTCDHGGGRIPRALGDLGLPQNELSRHIGWDIGAAALAHRLSERLDACLVEQIYSRLVIDCNRDPAVASSIPEISETTRVPGNIGLTAMARAARRAAIFEPYHARIHAELDRRAREGRNSVLVAVHSFTPVFKRVSRPWHIGVLYNRDTRLAQSLLRLLEDEGDLVVGDNEPYRVSDKTDYGIPVHGEGRGLIHVELEIRQDLITDLAGQRAWAERLAYLLVNALAHVSA